MEEERNEKETSERNQSDAEEQKDEEIKEKGFGKKVSKAKLDEALAALEKANADRDYWKNEYYKAYADTKNLRSSLEEEQREAIRYRAEGFLVNLLPALDGFHMALETPVKSEEVKNYLVGFQYIYNQIVKTLNDEGVTEISPVKGDAFDVNLMHAIEAVEDDSVEPGKVVSSLGKGYKLHDRLIRPAMVTVAKAKENHENEQQSGETPVDEAHKA